MNHLNKLNFIISENSVIARLARYKLKSANVAMVIGNKIYLSGVSKDDFLKDEAWLQHELIHIRQFQEHGFFRFLYLYLIESLKKGYYNNKYEVEAREGAKNISH